MKLPTKTQVYQQHATRMGSLILASIVIAVVVFVLGVAYGITGPNQAFASIVGVPLSLWGLWHLLIHLGAMETLRYIRLCALLRFMEGYPMTVDGALQSFKDRHILEDWTGFEQWRIYKQELNNEQ